MVQSERADIDLEGRKSELFLNNCELSLIGDIFRRRGGPKDKEDLEDPVRIGERHLAVQIFAPFSRWEPGWMPSPRSSLKCLKYLF